MENNMTKKIQTFHDYMQSIMAETPSKKINKRGKMAKGDYQTGLFGGGQSPAAQAAAQAAAQRSAQAAAQAQQLAAQRAAEQAQQRADAQANQRAAQARAAQQTTPQAPQAQSGANGAAQAAQAGATKPVYSAPTGNGAAAAAQLGNTVDPEARRRANQLRDARQQAAQAAQASATRPVYNAPTGNGSAAAAQLGATTDPILRRQAEVQRALNQRASGSGVGQFINNAVSNVLRNFATTANAQEVENPTPKPTTPEPPPPPPPNESTTPETVTVAPKTITPVTPNPEPSPETPSPIVPGEGGVTTPVPSSLFDWAALQDYLSGLKGTNATSFWENAIGLRNPLDFQTIINGVPYKNTQGQNIGEGLSGFFNSYFGSPITYKDAEGKTQYIPDTKDYADPRSPDNPYDPSTVKLTSDELQINPVTGYDYNKSKTIANAVLGLANERSRRVGNSLVPYNDNPLALTPNQINELARASQGKGPLSEELVKTILGKVDLPAQQRILTEITNSGNNYQTMRNNFINSINTYTKNPKDYPYLYQNPATRTVKDNGQAISAPAALSDLVLAAGDKVALNEVGTAVANVNNVIGTQTAGGAKVITPPPTLQPTLTPRPTMNPSLLINPTAAAAASQTAAAGGGGGGNPPRSGGGSGNTTITGNGAATAASAPFTRAGVAPDANGFYPVPPEDGGMPWEPYRLTGSHGLGTKKDPMQIYPDQPSISDLVRDDWAKNAGFYARNPKVTVVSNVGTPTRTPYNPAMGQGLTGPAKAQREAQASETANALRQTAQATKSGIFEASMTPTVGVPTKTFVPSQNFIPSPTAQPQPQQSAQVPYSLPGLSNASNNPFNNFLTQFGVNPFGAAPRMNPVQSSLSSITPTSSRTAQPTQTLTPSRTVQPTQTATPSKTSSLNVDNEIAQILNNQRLNQQQAASAYPQFASTGPTKQARMSPNKKTKKLKKDIGVGTGLTAHATQPVPESPMPKIRTSYGSYKFKKPQQQRSAKYGEDQQLNQPIRKQINAVQPRQTMSNVMQFPPSDAFQPFAKMMINPTEKYEKNDLTKSLQQTSKYNNAYSNKKYEK